MAQREKNMAQATLKTRSKSHFKNCHLKLELSVKRITICQDTSTAFRGLFAQGCLLQPYISSRCHYSTSPPRWLQTAVNKEEEGGREQGLRETLQLGSSIPWTGIRDTTANSDKRKAPLRRWRGIFCGVPFSRRERHGFHKPGDEAAACPRRAVSHSAWGPGRVV